jgi:glycosyltransferase involved in cell wall biosynthesis
LKSIIFIHQSADLYGSDKVLFNLADRLRSYGYCLVVILPYLGPLASKLTAAGIDTLIHPVGKVSRATLSFMGLLTLGLDLWKLYRFSDELLQRYHFDLVYSNTIATVGGALLARIWKIPHVWHVHEIIHKPIAASRLFPRLVCWCSDMVISNSQETARWLETVMPSLKAKNVVVWNGIDNISSISSTPYPFRKMWGMGDEDIVIALVGRINRWKGHWLLLDAIEQLNRNSRHSIKLVFVGDPPIDQQEIGQELRYKVAASTICDRVVFQSFVDDIHSLWLSVDIAAVPSLEPEPFGLVAIEAMRAGKPVIGAAHGGLLEIIVDGKTGLLFPPGDVDALASAVLALVESPSLRANFGRTGRERQQHLFSLDAQVKKTIKCLETLE